LEDDEHTGQPRMARIELNIQEVTMLVHANCNQPVHKIAAAAAADLAKVLATKFCLMI
jgi:hypothetical protein